MESRGCPVGPGRYKARTGGDEDLLAEFIDLFVEDAPKRLAAIGQSVASANPELVRKTAHHLKGASSAASLVERPTDVAVDYTRTDGTGKATPARAAEVFSILAARKPNACWQPRRSGGEAWFCP